jgi:HAD superfamily hydrolase (TIGR01490 family)
METGVDIVKVPGARQAAFFDLEKTLTPHATEQECAVILARRGLLPWASLARVLFIYAQYNLGLLGDFEALKRSGAVIFKGREHERDRALVRQLFDEHLSRHVFPQARELVGEFQRQGFEITIVSSTYRFMVEPYAAMLGIPSLYGVDLELDGGVCTGHITGTIYHQERKADVVRAAGERGISLADSYAFGDSMNDLPMLSAVGHPVAVNPGSKLRSEAERRGWNHVRWKGR